MAEKVWLVLVHLSMFPQLAPHNACGVSSRIVPDEEEIEISDPLLAQPPQVRRMTDMDRTFGKSLWQGFGKSEFQPARLQV